MLTRTSAAADAKQHSQRARGKDPAWNVPPGSVPTSKQNHYQQADGPQRPGTDAEVGRGRPQRRPRRKLGSGGGSHGHRRRVARSRVRAETCRRRRRQSGSTEGQIIGETSRPRDIYGVTRAGAGGEGLRRRRSVQTKKNRKTASAGRGPIQRCDSDGTIGSPGGNCRADRPGVAHRECSHPSTKRNRRGPGEIRAVNRHRRSNRTASRGKGSDGRGNRKAGRGRQRPAARRGDGDGASGSPGGNCRRDRPGGAHREGSRYSIKRNRGGPDEGRAGNGHTRSNRTEGGRERAEADAFEESYDVVGCGGPNRDSVDRAGKRLTWRGVEERRIIEREHILQRGCGTVVEERSQVGDVEKLADAERTRSAGCAGLAGKIVHSSRVDDLVHHTRVE